MSHRTSPVLLLVERHRSVQEHGPRPAREVQPRGECPFANLLEPQTHTVVALRQRRILHLHQVMPSLPRPLMGIKLLRIAPQISRPNLLALPV